VKNEANMLWRRGMVSRARSISMYRVCTLFWRFSAPGRGGCVEVVEEGCVWWQGRSGRTLWSFEGACLVLVVVLRAGAL
jgi:hypothetical protein